MSSRAMSTLSSATGQPISGSACSFMMVFCRSAQLKALSKVAIGPSIFDINEPMIFGIPTMMNVLMYIPMVIYGALNFTLVYLCMDAGLVTKFYLNISRLNPSSRCGIPFCNGLEGACPLGNRACP